MKELKLHSVASLLFQTYQYLEAGNMQGAIEEIQFELQELVQNNPAAFFELLQQASYDRPSAWREYCRLINVSVQLSRLELAMHAESDEPETYARLQHYFLEKLGTKGAAAFKVLYSSHWDT